MIEGLGGTERIFGSKIKKLLYMIQRNLDGKMALLKSTNSNFLPLKACGWYTHWMEFKAYRHL